MPEILENGPFCSTTASTSTSIILTAACSCRCRCSTAACLALKSSVLPSKDGRYAISSLRAQTRKSTQIGQTSMDLVQACLRNVPIRLHRQNRVLNWGTISQRQQQTYPHPYCTHTRPRYHGRLPYPLNEKAWTLHRSFSTHASHSTIKTLVQY